MPPHPNFEEDILLLPAASLRFPDPAASPARRVRVRPRGRSGALGPLPSREGVKNISSVWKPSGGRGVTLERKQRPGRQKSKSTRGQGGLMHTNGFCHLWLGKIYDSAPQSCKQSTKQQTLAPDGRVRPRHLKGGAGRRRRREPQKSAPRRFPFTPAAGAIEGGGVGQPSTRTAPPNC